MMRRNTIQFFRNLWRARAQESQSTQQECDVIGNVCPGIVFTVHLDMHDMPRTSLRGGHHEHDFYFFYIVKKVKRLQHEPA